MAKGSKGVPCRHSGDGFNGEPASLARDNIFTISSKGQNTDCELAGRLHKDYLCIAALDFFLIDGVICLK